MLFASRASREGGRRLRPCRLPESQCGPRRQPLENDRTRCATARRSPTQESYLCDSKARNAKNASQAASKPLAKTSKGLFGRKGRGVMGRFPPGKTATLEPASSEPSLWTNRVFIERLMVSPPMVCRATTSCLPDRHETAAATDGGLSLADASQPWPCLRDESLSRHGGGSPNYRSGDCDRGESMVSAGENTR